VVSLGKFVSLCDSEQLKVGLSDHLSEERVERDPALGELLNEDVGFFVNLNLRINLRVSCLIYFCCCYLFHNLLACRACLVVNQSLHSLDQIVCILF
jgi:hypothetical protein